MDEHTCGWICLNPDCPKLAATALEAEELEAGDLVEAGVPTELARRLTKLILRRADEADAPLPARERAQADLAQLRVHLSEAQRHAGEAAAIADRLAGSLRVSFTSDDFAEGEHTTADLAVASALGFLAAHTAGEACAAVAAIDPVLPGLVATDEV